MGRVSVDMKQDAAFCPVSSTGCKEKPICPWPCKKLKYTAEIEDKLDGSEYQLLPVEAYHAMRKLLVDAKRWQVACSFMTAADRTRCEKAVPDYLEGQ